ncbi:MAG: hypothetical protein F6J94_10320 [Moorea sp. SIO1F2]|uniref:hypothetical protein n=1 Tax=Moorena sp. SIO1F2 TaxID=2607819 RepID=UPI0013B9E8F0|nr:hypothetical protein [Moorena sp. SIO1F2]NET82316.1 hypothetical protein [Moorena sp. SIO1F2]
MIQAALAVGQDDTIYLRQGHLTVHRINIAWCDWLWCITGRALPVEGASAGTSQCFCIQNTIIARCCNKPYTSCPKG